MMEATEASRPGHARCGPGATARISRRVVLALCCLLLFAAALPAPVARAQDPYPGTEPEEPAESAPPPAAVDYFFPDLPKGSLVHDGRFFKIKPIIAIVGDYNWFEQDDASLAQVGEQENTQNLRAGRFGLLVSSKGNRKWVFTLTADYQEKRTRDDDTWQVYDFKVDIPFGPVKLTLGKQKEPFSFEMTTTTFTLGWG